MGILKSLYPENFNKKIKNLSESKIRTFSLVNGNDEIYKMLLNEKYVAWKMIQFQKEKVEDFKNIRKKYLLY